jgi:hypothetical protein
VRRLLTNSRWPAGWQLRHHASGKLVFRTGLSWSSWGEVISLRLEPIDETSTLVHLHSRPWLPTTLIDYGKNQQNLAQLQRMLTDLAPQEE